MRFVWFSYGFLMRSYSFHMLYYDVFVFFVLASRGARLGRRLSHCVVASKVWGCVGGCQILVFCFCVFVAEGLV